MVFGKLGTIMQLSGAWLATECDPGLEARSPGLKDGGLLKGPGRCGVDLPSLVAGDEGGCFVEIGRIICPKAQAGTRFGSGGEG